MRWILVLAFSTLSGVASAQYADYNRSRAYQHFLNSPAKVKVLTTGATGFTQIQQSPFEYRRFSATGTYDEQRISPKGYERYRILPGYTIERSSPYEYRFVEVPPLETYSRSPILPVYPAPAPTYRFRPR